MVKISSIPQLKTELGHRSSEELLTLCLRLAKFKKENKELLTYLLFEAEDEEAYIDSVKQEMRAQFASVNTNNYYWMRKSARKILKEVKKHIRYSQKKETEVELLLGFCIQLKSLSPSIDKDKTLQNLFDRQLALVRKTINVLHEDLQYDFSRQLEELI